MSIYLIIYLLGWIASFPRISWHILDMVTEGFSVDKSDRVMSSMMGFFAALCWPVIVPIMIAHRIFGEQAILCPPADVRHKQKLEARERAIEERERRIAQIERECGIGTDTEDDIDRQLKAVNRV